MGNQIHTFQLDLDFSMMSHLRTIHHFTGEWSAIAKREGAQTLKQLKSVATVESTGASTRIEGARMTNDEVKEFLSNLTIEKLEERDQQEVKGYYHVLDIISEAYNDIDISEQSLKSLHNELMRFSDKDEWHKGGYKQHPNSVERTNTDGSKTVVFDTTPPGIETEDAMRALMKWYKEDNETPTLIKSAFFVYDFLSIHPFQDGNGRLSRLLGTLLLLKNGYPWIEYVSFEHEIEQRKAEYYRVLMECQHNRPGENVTTWLLFFLDCMTNIQEKLRKKLSVQKRENQMAPREKMIYVFVDNHPGCSSGEIAKKLNIPLPTVKRILSDMVAGRFLTKHGAGSGTNYTTEKVSHVKTDLALTLTNELRSKELLLHDKYSSISIKKIILNPKFEWKKPDDWGTVLLKQQLELKISCDGYAGGVRSQTYQIYSFNSPTHYQPVFTLPRQIEIPTSLWEPNDREFPIRVVLEVSVDGPTMEFDVMLIYDVVGET